MHGLNLCMFIARTHDNGGLQYAENFAKGLIFTGYFAGGDKVLKVLGIIDFIIFIRSPENQEYNVMKYCYRDPIMINPVVKMRPHPAAHPH